MPGSMMVATKGSIDVRAGREAVWAALHDPDCIAACVPGCRRVTRGASRPIDRGPIPRQDPYAQGGAETYAVEAAIRLGPVHVPFGGIVAIGDSEMPVRLSLTGRGKGGLAGAASGTAEIRLDEHAGGCRLAFQVEARIEGPMAQLGPFLLGSLATSLGDRFARRFVRLVEFGLPSSQGRRFRSKAPSSPTMSRSW